MQQQQTGALPELVRRMSDYLPTLAAGLLVLALGVAAGWLAKRLVVRILIWLRLDRLAGQVGWRAAMGKGDVRAAFYNMLGTVAFAIVVLIFLDNALQIWGLTVLSRAIDNAVFYLPNLLLVALLAGIGSLVANLLSRQLEQALEEEELEHARLVAKLFKGVLLAIVGALVLWQLDFARQVVLAAFLIAFGAVGVAFAVALGLGSARAVQHGWESLFEKKKGR
jgi:Mechanosensitive ion channel, conserved TM helix